jgi:AraC family transcriptional regulator
MAARRRDKLSNGRPRPQTIEDHRQRVLRALVHIEEHLESDLRLETLARRIHMSPFHFQRVFQSLIGESPAGYVRRLRVELAAARLSGGVAVAHVWARAGFAGPEPFIRAFRRAFGCTPGVFADEQRHETRAARRAPAELRTWVNRPRDDGQLRFVPCRPRAGKASVRVDWSKGMRVAFVRRFGGSLSGAQQRADFARLVDWARSRGRIGTEFVCATIVHDDPALTPASRRRIDRCVAVAPRTRGEGDIAIKRTLGGDFAVATVQGSTEQAARQSAWVREQARGQCARRAAPGATMLVHLTPPWESSGQDAGLIDILVPVEPGPPLTRLYFLRKRSPAEPPRIKARSHNNSPLSGD